MKKILVLCLTILFMSGCSKNQVLTCTMEDKSENMTMVQTVEGKFKGDDLSKAIISIEYTYKDKNMLDTIKEAAKGSFEEFDEYKGIKTKEIKSSNKYTYELIVDVNKTSDDVLYNLNLKEKKYLKLFDSLQGDGYICK